MNEWVDVEERSEKKCMLLFSEIQPNPHMFKCVPIRSQWQSYISFVGFEWRFRFRTEYKRVDLMKPIRV